MGKSATNDPDIDVTETTEVTKPTADTPSVENPDPNPATDASGVAEV